VFLGDRKITDSRKKLLVHGIFQVIAGRLTVPFERHSTFILGVFGNSDFHNFACPGTASTRSAAMDISSRAQSVVDFLAKGPVLWSIG